MGLQHQQLKQLSDWLDTTETRIKRMGAQPLGPELDDIKRQIEEQKVCPGIFFVVSFNKKQTNKQVKTIVPTALTGRSGAGASESELSDSYGGGSR